MSQLSRRKFSQIAFFRHFVEIFLQISGSVMVNEYIVFKHFVSLIFVDCSKSVETAKIMCLQNLDVYGTSACDTRRPCDVSTRTCVYVRAMSLKVVEVQSASET